MSWFASSSVISMNSFSRSPRSAEISDVLGAELVVGVLGELLGLEADMSMELYFETLARRRLDPLAVDAFVLLTGPGILQFEHLEALVFHTSDVSPDALSVPSLTVLKG